MLVGGLTEDPNLRFIPSSAMMASFIVASTPRTFGQQTGKWRDGEAMFVSCTM